jgi:hypothetical protein
MDGDEPAVSLETAALAWPGEESLEHVTVESANGDDSGLWSKSRDFDWGD